MEGVKFYHGENRSGRITQSFQVEGPQDREISLFLRIKIGRFFTGTFQGAS